MEQSLYWKELYQTKFHTEYIELFLQKSENWDKRLNIFIAICSSASIAAWAIWKENYWIWTTIIAASQVIQAIKPFLPYQERMRSLSALRNGYAGLFVLADTHWPSIAEGEIASVAISKLRSEIRQKKLELEQKAFPTSSLPDNSGFRDLAATKAERYFQAFYGVT